MELYNIFFQNLFRRSVFKWAPKLLNRKSYLLKGQGKKFLRMKKQCGLKRSRKIGIYKKFLKNRIRILVRENVIK